MILTPFNDEKSQKVFSIIAALMGLLLMFFSVPFILTIGGYTLFSSAIGLILFFVGLIYFLEATIG